MKKSLIMMALFGLLASSAFAQDTPSKQPDPLGPGDHTRTLMMGELMWEFFQKHKLK